MQGSRAIYASSASGLVIGLLAISLVIPEVGISSFSFLTIIVSSILTVILMPPSQQSDWSGLRGVYTTFVTFLISCGVTAVAVAVAKKMAFTLSVPIHWAVALGAILLIGYCCLAYLFFAVVRR